MKKLLSLFLFCLFSIAAYSEEFSLFPWMCDQKDIYNYCINKGWEYHADTSSKVPEFNFNTPEGVTYHGYAVYSIHFMFDKNGKVVSQAITFSEILEAARTFPAILDLMVLDKTTLQTRTMETNERINITYKTKINDQVSANYVIYGQNNAFQLHAVYFTY